MNQTIDATSGNTEILNFVASRLLFFKRIDHAILLEVLNENFPGQNAENFLCNLINAGIAEIDNEHLIIGKESSLMGFLSIHKHSCLTAEMQ